MRPKNKVILLTHGGWGEGLIKSMGLLVGQIENVTDVALTATLTLDNYVQKIRDAVDVVDENTIVLTDIPGGTTSNVALKLTIEYPWHVISGVNALMLVETILHQDEEITSDILDKIVNAGKQSQKLLRVERSVQ